MDKLIDIGDKVLNIYNSSFNLLILFIIIGIIIKGISVYQENDKNKKMKFRVTLHIGLKKLTEQIIVFVEIGRAHV